MSFVNDGLEVTGSWVGSISVTLNGKQLVEGIDFIRTRNGVRVLSLSLGTSTLTISGRSDSSPRIKPKVEKPYYRNFDRSNKW